MRRLIILATICLSFSAKGQTLNQKDLIELVKLAFKGHNLPSDIVPKVDTLTKKSLPERFVIIESNDKIGIKRQYDDKPDIVMIWSGEEIFLHSVTYWMKLLKTTRKSDRALVKYETMADVPRPEIPARCFNGEIRGRFNGKKWILRESSFTETDCTFGLLSKKK